MQRQKLVILGAGFGGLMAALELADLARKPDDDIFDITLIDQRDYQLFTPDLYEIASASRAIESADELKGAVSIDVKLALERMNITQYIATVQSIDRHARTIETSTGQISYDYLLVAVGSVPFDFGIPGVAEYAITCKSVEDALEIRRRTITSLKQAEQTHVVFCGAGPAGVEVAAEMAVSFRDALRAGQLKISVIDAAPRILATFSERVSAKAKRRLVKLGITVQNNFRIESIDGRHISNTEMNIVDADIVVWNGGIQANPLTHAMGLTLNKRGQIIVDPTLQSPEDEHIFAIGDCAQIPVMISPHPEILHKAQEQAERSATATVLQSDGAKPQVTYAPQTAHEAVEQGKVVARNILRQATGGHLAGYRMTYFVYVITLGGKYGLLILPAGIIISGAIAWFVRKFVDFRHFSRVLPFMHASEFWYRGMITMLQNDSGLFGGGAPESADSVKKAYEKAQ